MSLLAFWSTKTGNIIFTHPRAVMPTTGDFCGHGCKWLPSQILSMTCQMQRPMKNFSLHTWTHHQKSSQSTGASHNGWMGGWHPSSPGKSESGVVYILRDLNKHHSLGSRLKTTLLATYKILPHFLLLRLDVPDQRCQQGKSTYEN